MEKTRKNAITTIVELINSSGKNTEEILKLAPYFSALLNLDMSNFEYELGLKEIHIRKQCGLKLNNETRIYFIENNGKRTTKEIAMAGKNEMNESGEHKTIDWQYFPMRSTAKGHHVIKMFESNRTMTHKEALADGKNLGLKATMYEDALLYGEKYPVEGMWTWTVFLHEPVRPRFKDPKILCFLKQGWHRLLLTVSIDHEFEPGTLFAFRK